MRVRSLCVAIAGVLAVALPAWAHQSHGNYNMEVVTTLSGTVKEVHWMNPHSFIYLEVADSKNEPAIWSLEGQSVTALQRRDGFSKDAIKPGQQISVRCHKLRDGSNGCLLSTVTVNGQDIRFD